MRLKDPQAKIDLGGIAKGFIADEMRSFLNKKGITSGVISLGGNVLTLGKKADHSSYTIGIQKPFSETGTSLGTLNVSDASVVSSGIYECFTVWLLWYGKSDLPFSPKSQDISPKADHAGR